MPQLMVIADDLTGALDTGVKFAKAGLKTTVNTRQPDGMLGEGADVAVLCAETRHLPGRQAYRVIRSIVEENRDRFPLLMKKTDSGLRGNIGAELQAVMDGAAEKRLAFLPALPEMKRVTRGGVHYIDGVPVSRSVFGRDPFEPVQEDDIPSLLRRQCSVPTMVIPKENAGAAHGPQDGSLIQIYDAETAEDMRNAVSGILEDGQVRLLAGCAGLAQALAGELAGRGMPKTREANRDPLLVVCGSVNRISEQQLDYAEENGFARYHLPKEYLLGDSREEGLPEPVFQCCETSRPVIVDTFSPSLAEDEVSAGELEERRRRISRRLGELVKAAMDRGIRRRIMVIGGDTLSALMDALGCSVLTPVGEPDQGVVLSELRYNGRNYQILSKSGGFGSRDLLTKL